MKKILARLSCATLICFAITPNVGAQPLEKSTAVATIKNKTVVDAVLKETTSNDKSTLVNGSSTIDPEKSVKVSRVSLRAVKADSRAAHYFKSAFKDVVNPTWAVGQFGIFAYYTKNEDKTIAVFNKQGFLVQTLEYYLPEKTPKNIRSAVQDNYPNDAISMAIKVTEKHNEFFIVQLEDQRSYKQVSVYNDVVQLVDEYGKKN